jgi:YD repeat-containing protein
LRLAFLPYDAENRMTSETQTVSNVVGVYTYNADGQRVRRKVGGVETWQIYGMDGELLAEYPASGAATPPQKEYGYRNGQLLITAEPAAEIKWAGLGSSGHATNNN